MLTLSPDQASALDAMLHFARSGADPALALSGPAGTGKSTLIGCFLRETYRKVRLAATTHKAAAVASALAGGDAATVHRLFGLRPVNDFATGETRLERRREPSVNAGDLVIVDEASMIDRKLLKRLLIDAAERDVQILFVGDPYQLPPVSDAATTPVVFTAIPTVHLSTVHRQAADNPIIDLATRFRAAIDGAPYPVIRPRGNAIRRVDRPAFGGLTRELFLSPEYRANPDFVRLLAWTNARVNDLNAYVRGLLLGPDARRFPFLPGESLIVNEAITEKGEVILPNETRVTVLKSECAPLRDEDMDIELQGHRLHVTNPNGREYELFVPLNLADARTYLARLRARAQQMKALFDGAARQAKVKALFDSDNDDSAVRAAWRRYFEAKERMADLRAPHASTVHKSQGSTYRHVLVQVEDIARSADQPGHLLARLLYVASTRAAETATFYGALPAHLYGPTAQAA